MKLVRRYNLVVCVTSLVGALAYCAADDGTQVLALLSVLACGAGWFLSRGERPRAVPRWVVNVLMLLAIGDATLKVLSRGALAGMFSAATETPIVSVLSQFLVYILLIKLFDRRSARDEAHLVSLGVFVVVGAVLTSNSLLVGVLVLAFAPCVISAAMLLQLVGGARAVEDWDRAQGVAHPPGAGAPAAARRFRRDFGAVAALAVLGTFLLAAVAFVAMPRGRWYDVLGDFGKLERGQGVGFTTQIKLGDEGFLKLDNQTKVLRVRLYDPRSRDADLESMGVLRLRGYVKGSYDRGTHTWQDVSVPRGPPLRGAPAADEASPPAPGAEPGFRLRLGEKTRGQVLVRQTIIFEDPRHAPAFLFTLWRPLEIRATRDLQVQRFGEELVLRADTQRLTEGYDVVSAVEYADETEAPREPVTFPSLVVRELAERILTERGIPLEPEARDAPINRRAANVFQDYLQNRYQYTIEILPPQPGEDPIEMFLTRTRRGHCEYFASAMVALCQSVGLEARLVAGYLASEYDDATHEYTVRESNAHAWAEVRVAPGRWQTFDPSPPEALDRLTHPRFAILTRLRRWYESLNSAWSANVVTFDLKKQENLFGTRVEFTGILARAGELLSAVRERAAGISGVARLGVLAVAALVLGWGLYRAWGRRVRRVAARRAEQRPEHADPALQGLLHQTGFYAEALDLLRRGALAKPAYRPPVWHARALAREQAPIGLAFGAVAELFYRVRFGRRALSPAEAAAAREALAQLDAALRERARAGAAGDV